LPAISLFLKQLKQVQKAWVLQKMKTPIDFTVDYIIENEKVLLRPLQTSDFENLIRFSLEQPELWKYSL
jgi:hypothetical protein